MATSRSQRCFLNERITRSPNVSNDALLSRYSLITPFLFSIIAFTLVGCEVVMVGVAERVRTPLKIVVETDPPQASATLSRELVVFSGRAPPARATNLFPSVTKTTPCVFHPKVFFGNGFWDYRVILCKPGYEGETVLWQGEKKIRRLLKRVQPPEIELRWSRSYIGGNKYTEIIGNEYDLWINSHECAPGATCRIFGTVVEPPSKVSFEELQRLAEQHPIPVDWVRAVEGMTGGMTGAVERGTRVSILVSRREDLVNKTFYLTAVCVDADGGVHISPPRAFTLDKRKL